MTNFLSVASALTIAVAAAVAPIGAALGGRGRRVQAQMDGVHDGEGFERWRQDVALVHKRILPKVVGLCSGMGRHLMPKDCSRTEVILA